MAKIPLFQGGSYLSDSPNFAADRTVNLFSEIAESGTGKAPLRLRGCPGLSLFANLPTSPHRASWVNEYRQFVVSGSRLYEVFINGTFTDFGDVGDDADHTPAQIIPNGGQLLIISAGLVYLAGVTTQQVFLGRIEGLVDTADAAVTWITGDLFDANLVDQPITIFDIEYTVASVEDEKHLTLTASAGTQSAVGFVAIVPLAGRVTTNGLVVDWASGDIFDQSIAGQVVTINGVEYTVAAVRGDSKQLTLTTDAGVQADVPYSALLPLTAISGAFLDGYYIVARPNSKQINISALYNGLNWDPLDFGIKQGYPDNIVALLADHEELWIFGTDTTEVWRNTGNANFPFERDLSAFIHQGNCAGWATVRLNNGVAWIGGDPRGKPVAWRAQGFEPVRISTHAVEQAWARYSKVTDADGFAYRLEGHEMWQISFPAPNVTWEYDALTGLWHERDSWDGAEYGRHRARTHGDIRDWNKALVGDYASGKLYQMSPTLYDEAGTPIRRLRQGPHLSDEQLWHFFHRLQLDLEVGVGVADAVFELSWSGDGGHTFNTPIVVTAGALTAYTARVIWRRLGKSRDRIFRVTSTAAMPHTWINALIELSKGMS